MANKQNSDVENKALGGNSGTSTGQTEKSAVNSSGSQTKAADGANAASQLGGVLRGDTGSVKDIYDKAKESGGQIAGQAFEQAKDKAASAIDEQKQNLAAGLGGVADTIRQVGENLRSSGEKNSFADLTTKYSDTLAQQVEKVSDYFERKDVKELVSDVENFARRNPAAFIGAAFAVGLLAARFLKTSNPNQALMRRPQNTNDGSNREKAGKSSSSTASLTPNTNSPSV